MTVNIRVLRDFIAVQEVKKSDNDTTSVIEIVRLGDNRLVKGKVVAKGTGVLTANGQSHPIEVEVGDIILFDRTSAVEINHEGHKYLILNELSIRAVLL